MSDFGYGWMIGGGIVLFFVFIAYCAFILSGRIGDDMDGVGAHRPFEGSPFLPPEDTDRPEHDALADKIEREKYGQCPAETQLPPARESSAQKADMAQEIKVYRQTLEALAHFTSDPWAEHLARKVWDKPTTETAEFAIAQAPRMSPDQKKTKLVEAKGSALVVKDDKIGQYVLTVGQQIKWFDRGGGFQRGRIESFYENENAADDSDRWYVRVLDERTGKPRTVLSNRVQPLTKDLWT
jgi:hypothetical protein